MKNNLPATSTSFRAQIARRPERFLASKRARTNVARGLVGTVLATPVAVLAIVYPGFASALMGAGLMIGGIAAGLGAVWSVFVGVQRLGEWVDEGEEE